MAQALGGDLKEFVEAAGFKYTGDVGNAVAEGSSLSRESVSPDASSKSLLHFDNRNKKGVFDRRQYEQMLLQIEELTVEEQEVHDAYLKAMKANVERQVERRKK